MASSYVKWSTLYTCLLHSHKNNHFKGTKSDVATIQQLRLMPKTITDDFTKDGLEILSTMTTTSPTLNSSGKQCFCTNVSVAKILFICRFYIILNLSCNYFTTDIFTITPKTITGSFTEESFTPSSATTESLATEAGKISAKNIV